MSITLDPEEAMQLIKTIPTFLLAAVLLCACSNGNDQEKKPGKIETMTKEVGQEAVRAIKTPIDKAQAVANQEEQRAQEMNERQENQQ